MSSSSPEPPEAVAHAQTADESATIATFVTNFNLVAAKRVGVSVARPAPHDNARGLTIAEVMRPTSSFYYSWWLSEGAESWSSSGAGPEAFDFRGTERYVIVSRLGTGGMGVVYKALDRETHTHVALKALHARKPDALLRFKNEFRALQGLRHRNLVRLGELSEVDGVWFFTMELVEGVDFLSYVRARADQRDGALFHEGRLRHALAQLAEGLGALHAAGKIHRDVKPLNIRIDNSGRLVLLDFGLVIDVDSPQRLSEGWVIGTAAYMAPEQAHSDATVPASDFYAVGSLLYHALTGRVPFEGTDLEVLMRKQSEVPPPPASIAPGVPRDLNDLCIDLLQCSPDDRPSEIEILRRLGTAHAAPVARPRPPLHTARRTEFVGRDRELDAMLRALDEPRTARVFLVRGASGVGKTALLGELQQRVRATHPSAVVLSGRCYENESVPFKAIDGAIDALTTYLRALPRADAAALLPRNASLLAQVFPVLRRVEVIAESPSIRIDVPDLQERRRRAFTALRELFTRIAVRHPLVVAIDDLQWADPDSVHLIGQLLQPPEPPPIVAVLATRPRADASGVEPLTALPIELVRFELDALPRAAARELALRLLARHGVAATADDADTLADEAANHPMFLHELVAHVAAVGMDRRRMVKLDDALQARFHRLSAPAREVLELTCIAGGPTPHGVIAHASGLDFSDYLDAVYELRESHLVRTAGGRRRDTIETYHNRVREAAMRGLDDTERREYHRKLADALEATGEADANPDVALTHFAAAELNARAAHYARAAAQRAVAALAFDRAAARYKAALRLGNYAPDEKRALELALAQALANAGRGAEAVALYLKAAEGAPQHEQLEHRRRAMEQLLFSGRVDEGIRLVQQVLGELGDSLPATPRRALWALAWQRFRLRLRGVRWRERGEGQLRPVDLARVDVYQSIGRGLSLVDNIRGADFNCRALRHSLALGERTRVIRALAVEGVFLASQGAERRVRDLIRESQRIAERIEDPAARAYVLFPRAAVHYFIENAWLATYRLVNEAEKLFHAHVYSGGWETDTCQMYACFCLMYLGELRKLTPTVDAFCFDAERRGDLYLALSLRCRMSVPWMMADDAASGERAVDEAARRWTHDRNTFQVQHFFAMHSRAEFALYDGAPQRAAAVLSRAAAGLRRSMLLRIPIVACEVAYLRGRVALAQAAAARDRPERAHWAHEVRRLARRVERSGQPLGRGLGPLLRAGAAHVAGDDDRAVRLLREGIDALDQLDTQLYAQPARRALGGLLGGDAGARLRADADAWLAEQGVREPERFYAALVPAFA